MAKVKTDNKTRFSSFINVYGEIIKFDEKGICHDVNDDIAKQMVNNMEDINFYDKGSKDTKENSQKQKSKTDMTEERIEHTNEEKIENSQQEEISESETETLDDKGNEDEIPADTAIKEFNSMKVDELRNLAVQYGLLSDEDAKSYKKLQLVELLTNQVSS